MDKALAICQKKYPNLYKEIEPTLCNLDDNGDLKVFVDGEKVDFEINDDDDVEIKVLECDEELIKQSGGDRFFVSYANDTKIKTFKTEELAKNFKE